MARVVDISDAPIEADPGEPAVGAFSRVVVEPGGQQNSARPLLWPTGVAAIEELHGVVAAAPDVDYYVVRGTRLGGGGALPTVDGAYVYAPSLLPAYVAHFLRHDMDAHYWAHEPDTKPIRVPAGISVIHNNLVFGHWLLEMFPKLLLLGERLPHLRSVPIILPSTAPGYVRSTIAEVLKDWPVLTYERGAQHVEVETLFMPSMMHDGYQFHPLMSELIERHVAWARDSLGGKVRGWLGRAPRRIFISRRDVISCFRELTNFRALERVAVERGFAVVRPQEMSWRRQVELFSHADCIAGEYGSGMHNALFAPRGARTICLNWIVEVQSRIANFRDQDVGYLLPPDGEPRLFGRDGRMLEYEIDPGQFRDVLERFA